MRPGKGRTRLDRMQQVKKHVGVWERGIVIAVEAQAGGKGDRPALSVNHDQASFNKEGILNL